MLKSYIINLIVLVLLFNSCSKSQDKTEAIVQLSDTDLVYALSNYSKDSVFLAAFRLSKENYDPSKEYFIEVLADNLLKTDANIQLSAYFATFELKDKIRFNATNSEVIKVLKEEVKAVEENAIQILKYRLQTAYAETSFISKLTDDTKVEASLVPGKNTWSISVNKKVNKESLKSMLQRRADLGFWETYRLTDIFEFLRSVNEHLRLSFKEAKPEFKKYIGNQFDSIDKENPLFSRLKINVRNDGQLADDSQVGFGVISDTSLINKYLSLVDVKRLLPRDLKFLWDLKPTDNQKILFGLYSIKVSSRDGKPILDGNCIQEASGKKEAYGSVVSINMNAEGARIWSRFTKENIQRQIAIVVNDKVFTCPRVMSQIDGGRCEITGNFTDKEVNDLAGILNAGVMPPVKVKVLEIR